MTAKVSPNSERMLRASPEMMLPDQLENVRLAVLARALPVWRRTHAEVDAALGAGDVDGLRRDLRALSGAPQGTSR